MSVIHATDADFDAALSSGKPVLVDFHASWCGPCRQVKPVVEAIAAEYPEYAVVAVDVDQAPATAQRFGISGVPTLLVFDATGDLRSSSTGVRPKRDLLDRLAEAA